MGVLDDLLASIPDGRVIEVRIGRHWTAVVAESRGAARCGLASTLRPSPSSSATDSLDARKLAKLSARDLAGLAATGRPPLASVGFAALNALLPPRPDLWIDRNAQEILAERGVGRSVAMVGQFHFVERLRNLVGRLAVLDRRPREGALPEEAAPEVLPTADVVAITGQALVNGTLDGLLRLCSADSVVLILGPSTPLSPILFEHGIDLLSGTVVTDVVAVLNAVSEGATFRQMRGLGVRLVTMGPMKR